jgi:hypothetical protein
MMLNVQSEAMYRSVWGLSPWVDPHASGWVVPHTSQGWSVVASPTAAQGWRPRWHSAQEEFLPAVKPFTQTISLTYIIPGGFLAFFRPVQRLESAVFATPAGAIRSLPVVAPFNRHAPGPRIPPS